MVLSDKDIRERCREKQEHKPLIEPFEEKKLGAVSYDLSIDKIILGEGQEEETYELHPNDVVYIKMKQKLYMNRDIIGRIEEKNSRMRMGVVVSGPTYQPGHNTAIFLRVHNISSDVIVLRNGMEMAQIIFEKVSDKLEKSYAERETTSFQGEFDYRKYGAYTDTYAKQIKKMEQVKENIEEKENQIYANVLTLMSILMGVFSLITINLEAFARTKLDIGFIMVMNVTIVLAIECLMAMIMVFVQKHISGKKMRTVVAIIVFTFVLLIAALIYAK